MSKKRSLEEMELKTKYQYTYFIYPYIIEQKKYKDYLYGLLKNKKCNLKLFDRKKNVEMESYFLPEIKDKLFWSLDLNKESIKNYEKMDLKMKATVLAKKKGVFFEYHLGEDIPGKIGEKNGIFFDIEKVEIVCFHTGICFLLIKTVLDNGSSFSDVLNFNYKFKDIQSKALPSRTQEAIKIQTKKFNNMQSFLDFLQELAGPNILASKMNMDTEKLIAYSYTCLDQNSWNGHTDILLLEKEFEKYRTLKPASEQMNDQLDSNQSVLKEKYCYYGFSSNSTVLLTSESNIENYTKLLFEFENQGLYHFLYHLHQKLYLKKLNYEFQKSQKFDKVKEEFLDFVKKDWIYEVTNDAKGEMLDRYYKKEQNLEEAFLKLKSEYDLLYKEYEISKNNKHNNWLIMIISIMVIVNLINLWIIFGTK